MNYVLAGRSIGAVLGRSQGAAAQWWMAAGVTPIAAYAPKGAASLPDSYKNLANPGTYDCTVGVAPTFDTATGWTFANSAYLRNGLAPTSVNWSMLCRFSDAASSASYVGIVGGYNSNAPVRRFILYHRAGGAYYGVGNDGFLQISGSISGGVLGFSGASCYYNGSLVGTVATCATNTTRKMIIGGYLADDTTPQSLFTGKISSLWIGNTTLDAAAMAAQSAAMP